MEGISKLEHTALPVQHSKRRSKNHGHAHEPSTDGAKERSSAVALGPVLGKGASALVYKGDWNGREIAVKVPRVRGKSALDALRLEAERMQKVRHERIVECYGMVRTSSSRAPHGLAMEYISGGTLEDLLKSDRALANKDRLLLCANIAEGLAYIHSLDIIHTDIKSANILVTLDLQAKITDFGTSKNDNTATLIGASVQWLPPELVNPGPQDLNSKGVVRASKASDVYSFGVTMWEVWSRKEPYKGESISKVAAHITKGELNPLPEEAPPQVHTLYLKSCHLNPEERGTMQGIAQELTLQLEELASSESTPQTTALPESRSMTSGEELEAEYAPLTTAMENMSLTAGLEQSHTTPPLPQVLPSTELMGTTDTPQILPETAPQKKSALA